MFHRVFFYKICAAGKPVPAGARRAPYERPPVRCQQKRRRLTDHANEASVDAVFHSRHRTAAGRTNDRTGRSRFLFVLFLGGQEKNTFLLCQGEEYVVFSPTRKRRKESPRLPSRTLMLLLRSVYPRLEGVAVLAGLAQATIRRAEGSVRLETPCPQAQGARRVSHSGAMLAKGAAVDGSRERSERGRRLS